MFVTEADERVGRQIYVARTGVHNHFPVWSPDGAFIYFVQGFPLDEMDIWRIRPAGGEPERLTFHNSRVSFPTLLSSRTLLYLATDADGYGPWIYAMDVDRRVPHRISTGVEEYTSLAASADGRRLVATRSRSTAGLWRVSIGDRVIDASGATPISLPTGRGLSPRLGPGYTIYRAPKAGTDGLWKLPDGEAPIELWNASTGAPSASSHCARRSTPRVFGAKAGTHATVRYERRRNGHASCGRRARGARGTAWSPDGLWLAAAAANRDGEPRVSGFRSTAGRGSAGERVPTDPIWAPSGRFLVIRARMWARTSL
jgi:hypothetical protein